MGDLLTAVPALRALAAHDLSRPVTVAAPGWVHDLVRLVPGVHAAAMTLDLAAQAVDRPALAVNLHGRGPQSHEALQALAPGSMWAYRVPGVWDEGPDWVEDGSERERWCRLLRWYGVDADEARMSIRTPAVPSPAPGAVVLHVGGKDPRRRWPTRRFACLARAVRADGRRVVLTGGESDRRRAHAVAAAAGLGPDAVLAGRLDLLDLAALVARARLLVSGDTGAGHLASAYGTPSVLVFGPEEPEQWGPPPRPQHQVLRGAGPAPSASDVPLGAVVNAVQALLETRVEVPA